MKYKGLRSILLALALCTGLFAAAFNAEAAESVAINKTNFPDDIFRSYVSENFDTDGDGALSEAEIGAVREINIERKKITSLKGVEFFSELKLLFCPSNQLTSLDLSRNPVLETLYCNGNQLSSLDVSGNPVLGTLYCDSNQLTSLNLSGNPALGTLFCGYNQLTSLDLSGNPALEKLYCSFNQLTSLDLSGNSVLAELSYSNNPMTSLNLGGCKALTGVFYYSQKLKMLNLSGCSGIEYLESEGENSQLTTLNASGCTSLKRLYFAEGKIKNLDVSECTSLTKLEFIQDMTQPIESLTVTGCKAMTLLSCGCYLKMPTLDLSGCTALKDLYITGDLRSLDLSNCTALRKLHVTCSQLTELDVSKCKAMTVLNCTNTALTSLDLSQNMKLKELSFRYNDQLKSLVAKDHTSLEEIHCIDNQKMTSLNVNGCTALTELWCYGNGLESLNVGSCTALILLNCSDNQLTELNLSNCTALKEVSCNENPLRVLKMKDCSSLAEMICYGSKLLAMDISGSPHLMEAYTNGKRTEREIEEDFQFHTVSYNKSSYGLTVDADVVISTDPIAAPKITTQPKSTGVAPGKTATFKVTASGIGMYYQWYYRTSSSDSWTAVSSASGKKATYSLTTADRHDGYQYRCKVTNNTGTATSSIVTLTVTPEPKITAQPKGQSVIEGEKATFKVVASGRDLSYQWQYRTSSSGSWKDVAAASGKTSTYSLTTAAKHDGYQYRCTVTNAAGSVTSSAVTLKVISKPTITTQPKAVSVAAGEKATFRVAASGKNLSYQWYYRTSSSGSWKAVSSALGKKRTYTIETLKKHNGYQYRCKVSNDAGSVYSNIVKLTVK